MIIQRILGELLYFCDFHEISEFSGFGEFVYFWNFPGKAFNFWTFQFSLVKRSQNQAIHFQGLNNTFLVIFQALCYFLPTVIRPTMRQPPIVE